MTDEHPQDLAGLMRETRELLDKSRAEREDLPGVLAGTEVFCRRFLATLTDAHFCVLALWIAHTHVIDAAETTPYLHVTSAEVESGKTRLLEVIELLVYRPASILDPSAASLYRGLDSGVIVTLLIDEVDNFLPGGKADSDSKKTILGILNGGYRRGLKVPRVTDGRNLQWFEPFGPKALTGIGGLPQTLESRSIRYRMRRRRRDNEPVERLRRRHALVDAQPIVDGFRAWATDEVIAALADANPELPDALGDRQQDACELLVAIADLAGGEWPERARRALVAIVTEAHDADAAESRGTLLLADLRDAFENGDRLATTTLLDYLRSLDERPWGGWNEGKGLNARGLARMLRPFDIRSTTVRPIDSTDKPVKGYKREDCEDAFARYLVPPAVTAVTTAQPCGIEPLLQPLQDPAGNGFDNAANPHGSSVVTDVTDTGAGEGGGDLDPAEIERLAARAREWLNEGAE